MVNFSPAASPVIVDSNTRMKDINPRKTALEILIQLEKQHSNSGFLLQESLRDIPEASDRGLITDLVLGTLRWQGRLLFLIESFSKTPLARLDRAVILILQIGLYQLMYTGISQHAVIYETADLCKKMKLSSATSFVNGILRTVQKQLSHLPEPSSADLPSYLSIRFSHPKWMVKRWLDRFEQGQTRSLLEWNNQPSCVYVRPNELAVTANEAASHLEREGIRLSETEFGPAILKVMEGAPQRTNAFARGEFYIQDAGSEIIGMAINPQPGWQVLEVASAPGGKTFQLALRMKDQGRIVSVDSDLHRMKRWKDNISRLGIRCASPFIADARTLTLLKEFDAVVIDAPCSSLGILGRHPEIKWWRTEAELPVFQNLQLQILNACAKHVRKDGMLFYSVCSFEPEETLQVLERFLSSHSDFQQVQSLTLYPHLNHTDGFFLACLCRGTASL